MFNQYDGLSKFQKIGSYQSLSWQIIFSQLEFHGTLFRPNVLPNDLSLLLPYRFFTTFKLITRHKHLCA